uniref:Single domain-containing protein n=1 Tax=Timema tahoe TaxID=61484 RepID=A0A7R9IR78_9NEOP|nr:unnamed protein product [Timema tahoe]
MAAMFIQLLVPVCQVADQSIHKRQQEKMDHGNRAAELEEDPDEPQCFLREANKYYKKGSYPHPTECAIFTCDVIVGSDGKKKAEYIAFTCVEYDMDMIASGQCELMQSGVKDEPYPDCCNVYTCSDKDYK